MSALGACELLHDRYQVLRRIGRGGMGTVYEAVDLKLRNVVAVKQMTAKGEEADEAFKREATLLASLRHEALPVVIDAFTHDGSRFLVMQYIEGEDLEARVRRTGPCSEAEATEWAIAALRALDYLHGRESPIVHRDIKPSNIKLTPRGEVVLLDFGLAKGRTDHDSTHIEENVSIFGFTPNYAPLEQLEARGTDPRSDLYALAATLYHLVAGDGPPTAGDRAAAVVSGRPDPLVNAWPPGLSQTFRAVLTKALELDKERRYPSARAMLAALELGAGSATQTPVVRESGTRRVDAAAPSRSEVGRPIDVIAQVRFADSPLLGLEDWPSRRRPEQIEQASEHVRVEHSEDPTGRKLPARIRVALVAPDFEIRGANEYVIDVPPDDYSKRLVFLLTPQRVGFCRVQVDIYTAADAVLLGTLPVETEAVAESVGFAPVRATELVLGVMAAPPAVVTAESSRPVAVPPAAPQAYWRLPRWAYSAATLGVVLTSLVVWRSAQVSEAPSQAVPPAASEPLPDMIATPGVTLPSPAPPPALPPAAGLARPTPPVTSGRPSAAQQTAPPPPAMATPAPPPPAMATPAPPPPAMTAPAPPPLPTPPPNLDRPAGAAAVVSAAPPTPVHPLWDVGQSSQVGINAGDVRLILTAVERIGPDHLQVRIDVRQWAQTPVSVAFSQVETRVVDEQGNRYSALPGNASRDAFRPVNLRPGNELGLRLDFAIPLSVTGRFELTLAPAPSDRESVRFPPLAFRLPPR